AAVLQAVEGAPRRAERRRDRAGQLLGLRPRPGAGARLAGHARAGRAAQLPRRADGPARRGRARRAAGAGFRLIASLLTGVAEWRLKELTRWRRRAAWSTRPTRSSTPPP